VVNPYDLSVVSRKIVPKVVIHPGRGDALPAHSRRIGQGDDVAEVEEPFLGCAPLRLAHSNVVQILSERTQGNEPPLGLLGRDAQIGAGIEEHEPARRIEQHLDGFNVVIGVEIPGPHRPLCSAVP